MKRHWKWLGEIRSGLPEEGAADLLVMRGTELRSLRISRAEVDAALFSVRRVAWAVGATLGVLVAALVALAWARQSAVRSLEAMERAIVSATRADGNGAAPADAKSGEAAVVQFRELKRQLAVQDEAFRLYVSATSRLLPTDTAQMLQQIRQAGLTLPPETRSSAAVGSEGSASDAALDLLKRYVPAVQREALLRNQDLRRFMQALPTELPLRQARITSPYGLRRDPITGTVEIHRGTDIVSDTDPTVRAASAGTVLRAGRKNGYGLHVVMRSDYGIETLYGHLSRIDVEPGQAVSPGMPLGVMGSTGHSTGPHVHLEMRQDGRYLDPMQILKRQDNVQHPKDDQRAPQG